MLERLIGAAIQGVLMALILWGFISLSGAADSGLYHHHLTEFLFTAGWFCAVGYFGGSGSRRKPKPNHGFQY